MESEIGKKDIRVTLSSYDFLAYFIPGATFITIVLVIESYYSDNFFIKDQNRILIFFDIINKIKAYFLSPESHWSLEIVILVLFVIFSYMLGHVLASLSAIFLDRFLVGNLLRYPYIVLLKLSSEVSRTEFFRVILFLSFVFNLTLILSLFFEFFFNYLITIAIIIILIGLFFLDYIMRKNENTFIKIFLYLINKFFTIKIPFINLSIEKFVRFIRDFLIKFLGIYKEFSDEFIIKFKDAYENVFKSKVEDDKILVYWNCRNYILDKNPYFNSLLINWFNLYSFSRNLSTCLYFSFVYLVFILPINFEFYNNLTDSFFHENTKFYSIKIVIVFIFALSIIMLIRYYYLYFTYYNKYLLRTFYYLVNQGSIK